MNKTVQKMRRFFGTLDKLPTPRPPSVPLGHQACGSMTCEIGRPCCHGICGLAGGVCCGKPPFVIVCSPGSKCCNGFCILKETKCLSLESFGPMEKAWHNLAN